MAATLEQHSEDRTSTLPAVRLGNLDASIAQSMIERRIPDHLTPMEVIMGESSHSMSSRQASMCVKHLLIGMGSLEVWEPDFTLSATKVKAFAELYEAKDARKAVAQLNKKHIPELANTKLLVRKRAEPFGAPSSTLPQREPYTRTTKHIDPAILHGNSSQFVRKETLQKLLRNRKGFAKKSLRALWRSGTIPSSTSGASSTWGGSSTLTNWKYV